MRLPIRPQHIGIYMRSTGPHYMNSTFSALQFCFANNLRAPPTEVSGSAYQLQWQCEAQLSYGGLHYGFQAFQPNDLNQTCADEAGQINALALLW